MGADVLGARTDAVMLNAYQKLAEEAWLKTKNENDAKAHAVAEMRRMFGVTDLTGRATVMQHPPEKAYPELWPELMRDDLRASVKNWAEAVGVRVTSQTASGDTVDIDPLRRVELISDRTTDADIKAGRPASYVVMIRDDNGTPQRVAMRGADGRVIDRWRPDVEAIDKEQRRLTEAEQRKLWGRQVGTEQVENMAVDEARAGLR
jgi:hypothetical protein